MERRWIHHRCGRLCLNVAAPIADGYLEAGARYPGSFVHIYVHPMWALESALLAYARNKGLAAPACANAAWSACRTMTANWLRGMGHTYKLSTLAGEEGRWEPWGRARTGCEGCNNRAEGVHSARESTKDRNFQMSLNYATKKASTTPMVTTMCCQVYQRFRTS